MELSGIGSEDSSMVQCFSFTKKYDLRTNSVQRCVSVCKVKKVEHNVKRNTLTFFLYVRTKFIRTASLKISWKTKNIQRLPDNFLKNQLIK